MSPTSHLAAINFFLGDIQGGLGPFLATWLAQTVHWSPSRVGTVTTAVGLATLVLNGPAGALVDRTGRPRLLLGLACAAILAGTMLVLVMHGFWGVLSAQLLAGAGGTMVMPAVTSLTLGIVGKAKFPHQQGQNQAFNHGGVFVAGALISGSAGWLGPGIAFWVLGAMAVLAIAAIAATPARAWNGRRAHGWQENEPDETDRSHPILAVLANRRLLFLAAALGLFNLGNGSMLSLLGQHLVATGANATRWTAIYVIVAQLTMIPVALWAGSRADKQGRRHLLLVACAVLVARAVASALITAPTLLIAAEVLDGVGSGLLGVAVPVLVADLTWGSGRTQTALGTVNGLQGVGGALSGLYGGLVVNWFGWAGAFLALGVAAAMALAIALWLEETREIGVPYPASDTRTAVR
jgi:MFS family permease